MISLSGLSSTVSSVTFNTRYEKRPLDGIMRNGTPKNELPSVVARQITKKRASRGGSR